MHTKAVYRAAQEMTHLGFRTVRFNFRGVGVSTGTFEDGFGEEEDVRAALDWMAPGLASLPIVVGGVSFGSMVGLGVGVNDTRVKGLIAMGAPVHTYDYTYLGRTEKPVLMIQGEHDQFGTPSELRETLGHLGDHLTIVDVPGSGHLFEGFFDELRAVIREYFTSGPGAGILEPAAETVRGTTP
jgi:alpha/beta superfamily hydrolase